MQVRVILAMVLAGLMAACATKSEKAPAPAEQRTAGSTTENAASTPAVTRDVQDIRIMDLSGIDTTEEANWMNPNNPPALKRQYQKNQNSVILPEDVYPVGTSLSPSSWLFRFKNADAFLYVFLARTPEASALLDINLNTLDLSQQKGYHDMVIDLKDGALKLSYTNDGSADGYTRYVEAKKDCRGGTASVYALLAKDQKQYLALRDQYHNILNTIKTPH
jgi:hypothetical protein